MEGFEFYDSYVTLFKKRIPWMPWAIVLVSHEDICSISHYGKMPQCHDHHMLNESRHCQTLSSRCLPQVFVASQIFNTLVHLPGTSLQAFNM